MKFFTILCSLFLFNILFAQEHDGGTHTPNYCSEDKTCTHLKFPTYPTSKEESHFIVHILPKTETAIIENVQIKLWMDMGNGHGHGSAPVKIEAGEEAFHYEVSNAWFVMPGNWQILVSFKADGMAHQYIIPFQIKE